MMGPSELLVVLIIVAIRVFAIIYCGKKARSLNRDVFIWRIIGFFSPFIGIIVLQFLKPAK
jgi:hypothetical protein